MKVAAGGRGQRQLGGGGFALDLSPMLAMALLYFVGLIVVGAIRG